MTTRHGASRLVRGVLAFCLLFLLTAPTYAQAPDYHRLYRRSSALLDAEWPAAMLSFLDSLRTRGASDAPSAFAHQLMQARWYRHSGRLKEAYHLLDSLLPLRPKNDAYVGYLIQYQLAKTLLDLEVYDPARHAVQAAIREATAAGLQQEALSMNLLACEIDFGADNLEQAHRCYEATLAQARQVQDQPTIGSALIGMGNVFYIQEKDEEALQIYNEVLSLARRIDNPDLMMDALFNIGSVVAFTVSADSAIHLYETVLDTMTVNQSGIHFKADLLTNLASMKSDLEQHNSALDLIDQALAIHISRRDTASMARAHLFKATALWGLNRREAALEQALLANVRTRSAGLKAKALRKAAQYLEQLGRNAEAYELLDSYVALADSLARSRYETGIAGAQVRFETVEKERRIAEQDQALALASSEGRRKLVQRNGLLGTTITLALVVFLLYRAIRQGRRMASKQKQLHDKQVDQLLGQQEMKSINAMLEGQEKERERVAKDLHDRLGSMLGAIKHQLGGLGSDLSDVKAQQLAHYQKVNDLLDDAAGELRQISHDMAAATLSRFGLQKALADLRDTIHINGRLQVELNTFGLERDLERGVEIAVYRIIQELVGNVLKHAHAREIAIAVTRTPGRLSVVVSDNGAGFDPSRMTDGMGLSNVRARATAIGGLMHVDSTPEKGTTVSVECPVVE